MNRREKILNSLSKLEPYEMILVPHRIGHRCILAAKTNIAKQRLVEAAVWITTEDMRRMWMRETRRFMQPRPLKKNSGFINFIRNLKF
jgi:hypothetical protein